MSFICGLNEFYFDFLIYFISINLVRFKEVVVVGMGGDMLDFFVEFFEGLVVRLIIIGL